MWGLIFQEIVINTQPPSINANIVAHMRACLPATIQVNRQFAMLTLYFSSLCSFWLHTKLPRLISEDSFILIKHANDNQGTWKFPSFACESCIFPQDEKLKTFCWLKVETFSKKASFLEKWLSFHISLYCPKSVLYPSKHSKDVVTMTDTCNAANKLSSLLLKEVTNVAKIKASREAMTC